MKVKTWIDEYMLTYKKPNLKESSYVRMKYVVDNHIPEFFGDMELSVVKVYDVDRVVSLCSLARTRKYLYFVLWGAFRKAYVLGMISSDISGLLSPPKYKGMQSSSLTDDEISAFLHACECSKYRNVLRFLLFSGCRRSEALSLVWTDIGCDDIHLRGTKTSSSDRFFPINDDIRDCLSAQRDLCLSGERVFPYDKSNLSHVFKSICPTHKLHDLRHTFITLCARSNIHVKVCQKLVGHSDVNTTLRIYTHVNDDFIRSEFSKIDYKKRKSSD